jgi:hypothetical protein
MKKIILLFAGVISMTLFVQAQIPFTQFTLSNHASRDTKIIDLDGDGLKDIVMVDRNSSANIVWFKNLGNGVFSNAITLFDYGTTNNSSENIAFADFNNDGHPDFAADGYFSKSVSAFINDGAENFTRSVVDHTGSSVQFINTIDVNNDNYPEILAEMKIYNNTLGVIDSNGVSIGVTGYSAVVNDFNGDTFQDIVVMTYGEDIVFLANNGTGGFNSPQTIETGLDFGYYDMSVCDLDGDGNKDILYPSSDYFPNSSNIMKWYKSDGAGNFSIHNLMVIDTNYVVTNLFGADIDNDGKKDLVASMYNRVTYNGMIKCYWNQGGEIFDSSKYEIITTMIHYPNFVRVDDIDGDGDQDILTATFGGTGGMAWFQNQLIPNTTGVPEFNPADIKIYPNPANDNLTIEAPSKATIEILNIQGQLLLQQSIQETKTEIDISGLSTGIYYIKYQTEKDAAVKKLIKK